MHRLVRLLLLGWVFLVGCWPLRVDAGSRADAIYGVEKYGEAALRTFAVQVIDTLDSRQINVAILARAGRPRSELPRDIHYTHVAIAVFEAVRLPNGDLSHAYTVYNLYQRDAGREDEAYLSQDYIYDFVAGMAERDIAVCVPNAALQRRLVKVIRSAAYERLFIPRYNLLANPWVNRYDNCVTHTLKVCVAAIYQTDDADRIYRILREHFRPTRVRLGPLQSLGSHLVAGVHHDDKPAGAFQTATFESLEAFLTENKLAEATFTISLSAAAPGS